MARLRENLGRCHGGAHVVVHCLLLLAIIVSLHNFSVSKSPSSSEVNSMTKESYKSIRSRDHLTTIVNMPILKLPDGSNRALQVHRINGRDAILISPHLPQKSRSSKTSNQKKHGTSSMKSILLAPSARLEPSINRDQKQNQKERALHKGPTSRSNLLNTTTKIAATDDATTFGRKTQTTNNRRESMYGAIHFGSSTNIKSFNNQRTLQEERKNLFKKALGLLSSYQGFILCVILLSFSVMIGAWVGKKAVEKAYKWELQNQEGTLAYDIAYTTTMPTTNIYSSNDLLDYEPDSILFGSSMPPIICEGNNLDKFDI